MEAVGGEVKYDLICPDPPWFYADMPTANGGCDYPRMKLPELIALRPLIDEWAAETSALAMWWTGPHMESAVDLGRAWGFQFVTTLFAWCKTGPHDLNQGRMFHAGEEDTFNVYPGSGRYSKHATEYVGLWRRGSLPLVADRTVRQVIHAAPTHHSQKPQEAYRRLEMLWPNARRLEMFARNRRAGWDCWGNQVDKFAAVAS